MIMKEYNKAFLNRNRNLKRIAVFFQRLFKNRGAIIGAALLLVILAVCLAAPLITSYSPNAVDLMNTKQPSSAEHICGTDELGRDIFARLLYGGRYSLALGFCASLLGNFCGVVFGVIAGYFGGKTEAIIMRFMDIWMSIPNILLCILISVVLGSGFINTVIAMGISNIPNGTRMNRAQTLAEKSKEYLEAAESINCSKVSLLFGHLVPNIISPTIVSFTMGLGNVITNAAALSFIGLGIQPPTPEWGAMLSAGRNFIYTYPHLLTFPGLAIALTVLAINLLGDGLRDALDPKLKN